MVGQKLPDSLHDTDEQISHGLVARLHRYALKELEDNGFEVSTWLVRSTRWTAICAHPNATIAWNSPTPKAEWSACRAS
ncbi:hypothetical protein NKK48_30305 [Mesorhizobium sp. C386A]|uniref:hypothetical protein n=1 Tax=Mesorhizobium sp. C386A TaxID=2956831 RepID=UPI00333883C9